MAWKSIAKVPNQKVARWLSSFSSTLDGLFKIVWLFHDGYRVKQQHFTLSSATVYCFFTSHKAVQTGHWRTIWLPLQRHFLHSYTRTNHLATKCQDWWIRNMVRVHGDWESSSYIVDSRAWYDSSASMVYTNRWGQACCSVIDGKLKHAPAAKKSDINLKNIQNVTRCIGIADDSIKQFSIQLHPTVHIFPH